MTNYVIEHLYTSILYFSLLTNLLIAVSVYLWIKYKYMVRKHEVPLDQRNSLDDLQINEILEREPAPINMQAAADLLSGKVILVTGAGGSLGSELCKQICAFNPKKLIMLGHGENSIFNIENVLKREFAHISLESIIADIQDKKKLKDVFYNFQPEIVFHAAAHKHVPLMESNTFEAIKNNVFGTRNVAQCAMDYHTERFVFISTDKAVNATSIMGASKKLAELMLQSMSDQSETKFMIVRFGNVLGSRGSVVPLFKQQILSGGPVTVTHPDMIRYFMSIQEAVQLVLQACTLATGGETFVLDMGKPLKVLDLAHKMIQKAGLKPNVDISIVFTGIRPGEKLVEEIFTAEESLKTTKHDSIYVCEPIEFSRERLEGIMQTLEEIVFKSDSIKHTDEISNIIREFIPVLHDNRLIANRGWACGLSKGRDHHEQT